MKRFEEIIQDKLNTFEYPYEENSWIQFKRKQTLRKWTRFTVISASIIMVTSVIFYMLTNENKIDKNSTNTTQNTIQTNVNNNEIINYAQPQNTEKSTERKHQTPTIHDNVTSTVALQNNIQNQNSANNTFDINDTKNYSTEIKYSIGQTTQQGCVPLTVEFFVLNLPKQATCLWNFGDGTVSAEINPIHIFTKPGKYNISVKINLDDQTSILVEDAKVQAYAQPIARIYAKQEGNTIVFENQSKQFSTISWIFGDSILSEETWKYQPNRSGKYNVKLIAENQYGCKDTANKIIDFTYLLPVQFADAFTPDGDGVNDVFGPQVMDFSYYQFTLQIYNKTGKMIYETKGSPVWWDGSDIHTRQNCPTDVYFYKVIAVDKLGNKQEFSGKIQLIR
ncbi:MAG: gliding motility-associated C-terminal domain-containing protein [Bacteroidales bacterium]|nr:gliding motility-associated C-terminal domain-containing protein [Bacteroidales bacterium]